MSRTNGDSKNIADFYGGDIYPLIDGKIEMPPENSKSANQVLNFIFNGVMTTISFGGNCKAEDILSKEQIKQLEKNRESRKTEKALARTKSANQR